MFGDSISAENERVKLEVKQLNSFKNSLAKKFLRPEGQKYKQRRVGTAEAFRGGLGRT